MNEQVKTTSAQLSGESGITKTLEKLQIILYFLNSTMQKEEEQHEDIKEIMRLERIKKKNVKKLNKKN